MVDLMRLMWTMGQIGGMKRYVSEARDNGVSRCSGSFGQGRTMLPRLTGYTCRLKSIGCEVVGISSGNGYWSGSFGRLRQRRWRRRVPEVTALFGGSNESGSRGKESPPKPSKKFSKADLKRIKQTGPTIEDLRAHFEVAKPGGSDGQDKNVYDFVPYEVLGSSAGYEGEPKWTELKQISYMEFYAGLRERNWTSKYYNPDAPQWDLKFYQDSGRLFRPSFVGYRVLVTKEDGSQVWVNLDRAGPDSFLRDYLGMCLL